MAQLVRALRSHRRGHRFESYWDHQYFKPSAEGFFIFISFSVLANYPQSQLDF